MISDHEYLLTRCLRLEAKIADLEQQRADSWTYQPFRRVVQAGDREKMRALRAQGLGFSEVGRRLGWADSTVARHTREALMEREVGGQ
jgi:hypothetical protein